MSTTFRTLVIVSFLAVGISCQKEKDNDTVDCTGILPAKITFQVNGGKWCSDLGGFADLGTDLTIYGQNQKGSTLTMELDSLQQGSWMISEDVNHFLYTDALANGFESTNDNPGNLVIDSHDTSTNTIKGHFTVTLRSPVTGNLTLSAGTFTAVYTE